MERYLLSGNFRIKHQHGAKALIFIPQAFFHLQTQRMLSSFKPQCHLLTRKSVGDFFPSSALDNRTNCRHPHCSSCRYIQTVTSAVCSPNMCTRPVKPNHCVLGGFTMKRAFYNSLFQTEMCSPPPGKTRREDPDECFKCNCRLFGLWVPLW